MHDSSLILGISVRSALTRCGEPHIVARMHVYRSNRTEELLAALADVISVPLADPFAPECIVVQGRGMERWLSQALAARHGVFANARFPFPRALLEEVLASVLGKVERPGIDYEPEAMMWSITELLPGLLDDAMFRPIAHYLEDDPDSGRRIQLAERIADIFDHYVTYRPEMVLAWEAGDAAAAARAGGGEPDWQPILWRALVARHGASHLAARVRTFLSGLAQGPPDLSGIPKRLCFFGFSTLPPLYLSAFAAIAQHVELHLFILSPSSAYWADIRSEREVLRRLRTTPGLGVDQAVEALHLADGNPLLASMGRVGRDFQEILEGRVDYSESSDDLYRDPLEVGSDVTLGSESNACLAAANMLHVLQSDILNLRDRGKSDEPDAMQLVLRPEDNSIRVHACHSPMREAEVLRDQLLDLFARDPSLEARDVVVMCPDVDAYAPFVEAVFAGEGDEARIPSRFADRSASASFEIVEAFTSVLDALVGRADASTVLDLLGIEALRARFGVAVDEAPRIQEWVKTSGIRWGMDAAHRHVEGLPDDDQNTWRFGLDRLLLGYAMPDSEDGLVGGRRPVGGVEGQEAALLGKLADFCETLFGLRARVAGRHGLDAWRLLLGEVLERMLVSDRDNLHEHQRIRDGLEAIAEAGDRAGFEGEVDLETFRAQLARSLDRNPRSSAFLSGGVTFCEMIPMRTIPFRVVCLIGLGDEAFPRVRRPLSFDLMAEHRLAGDRSSRDDDRYLFLEALLAARDNLIITYVGHDLHDNEARPASVLVGELIDYLATAFVVESASEGASSGSAVRDAVLIDHFLQPFSPSYFNPDVHSAHFSYSTMDHEAAQALASPRVAPPVFVTAPLASVHDPGADGTPRVIELERLERFFQRPVEMFLRERLGLWLGEEAEPVEDREPTNLNGLDAWAVGERLLTRRLAGGARSDELDLLRAEGYLPLGAAGASTYVETVGHVDALEGRVRALQQDETPREYAFDTSVGEFRLVGHLHGLYSKGYVRYGFSKLERRSEVGCWIRHLALCCARPEGIAPATFMIGRGKGSSGGVLQFEFMRPDDPAEILASLIDIYTLGQRTPLPLFPKASRIYATVLRNPKNKDPEPKALRDAQKGFQDDKSGMCEKTDPYNALAFAHVDPLAEFFHATGSDVQSGGFQSLSVAVFESLLAHRGKSA
jgi:exodeoxyribonuclease V gamma subunit